MNVFDLRDRLIDDYRQFSQSFLEISASDLSLFLERQAASEASRWPEPRLALNPTFTTTGTVQELADRGLLHPRCADFFRKRGVPLELYRHQMEAIEAARRGASYVLTTGTGSGKSLAYLIPAVDEALRTPSPGVKALVVYPMNALVNSQHEELRQYLEELRRHLDDPNAEPPATFHSYTGQESERERTRVLARPPDILLTNYVMLDLLLTRPRERDRLVDAMRESLRFLVLDELHTYRGRQGADVALLVRRLRQACRRPAPSVHRHFGDHGHRWPAGRAAGGHLGGCIPDFRLPDYVRRGDHRDARAGDAPACRLGLGGPTGASGIAHSYVELRGIRRRPARGVGRRPLRRI